MADTPEFLKKEKESINEDALEQLKGLVEVYKSREQTVKELEEELKDAKKLFNDVSQKEIPELLHTYDLSEIKLKSGEKVIVKEDISVTISDTRGFFQFLKHRNEDDLIKLQVAFGRMDSEKNTKLFAFLLEGEYEYEMKRDVHAQTKKKYFKELLGLGEDDIEEGLKSKKYLNKEEVEPFAKLFVFNVTKIK